MNRIIHWVKAHRWETAVGVLSTALVVVLALLVLALRDSPEPDAVGSTTTTEPPAAVSDTTVPEAPDEGVVSTTLVGSGESPVGPTAVVVDNVAEARPQIGIAAAELIIETPVEGGLTRFTALYGDQAPELVGPVRSLRPVSADLLSLFGPAVFTTGGQAFVTGPVTAAGATIVTPDESIAFQSLERPQPHHVFVSPAVELPGGVEVESPWVDGDWPGGDTAGEVTIPISGGVIWRYENEVYVRYQEGEPFQVMSALDADPEPLTRETLILLVAHQRSAGYTDSAGADVPTFDVVGGGDLYVLHAGELIEGTWFRANQAEDYTFTDGDGDPIPIPPGSTYLAIVPEGSEVEVGG